MGCIGFSRDASQVFEDVYFVFEVLDALVDLGEGLDVFVVLNACVECVDACVERLECALKVVEVG